MLGRIQNDLFDLGADLAVPEREGKAERLRVVASQVERLERDIDAINDKLAPLTSFVLPGGTPRRGPSARRAHDMPQGGTGDRGTGGPARRAGQRSWHPIYEPPVGLPVRGQPGRQW